MNLPTGTVTFLFTDIEGSTTLWERCPDAMRLALTRHDLLLRQAIERHNGYVFKTVGDAFCAAFPTALDALHAALEAHLALAEQEWEETGPIRVRMGLHTGEAQERDNDYFGQTLNRVARLQGVGHGQQTLLSQATYELVKSRLPANATLSDLGMHRLKDLAAPEHLWQLLHPSLPQQFPALKSLEYQPNNLPQQLTSFIGREKEINAIKALLGKTRLLTLTGSGGCGKTRLALQVAADVLEQFPDGVWLVELASLSDPALAPQTVASALGLREQPGKTLVQTLTDYLESKRLLLVLDNCEHLLSACAQLCNTLLRACPHLTILASSREGLGIAGEQTYRVPSLGLPDPKEKLTVEQISRYEAVRLFTERAGSSKSDFTLTNASAPALAAVCHRLDGIPLAIELAAARIRSLSVEEIDRRLDNRFRLLTGGSRTALPRHQTLRALIDWSYDLLTEQERRVLARLSVFAGGWTLEAAEFVCAEQGRGKREEGRGNARDTQTERAALRQPRGERAGTWEQEEGRKDEKAGEREGASEPISLPSSLFPLPSDDVLDLLTSLVDKSLVIVEAQEGSTRYRLLETVRQYARERLEESGGSEQIRVRHRDYCLKLAEDAEPKLGGLEQRQWLEMLETEHDNLRQALTFSLEAPEGAEAGLRLGAALRRFWNVRGHYGEGREFLGAVLGRPVGLHLHLARAQALNGAGTLARNQGDYGAARALFEESLALFRELGDRRGIAHSLTGLGNVAWYQGDYGAARALFEESLILFRELGDSRGIALSLNNLGLVAANQGDYAAARTQYEECLALFRELGERQNSALVLNNLGNVAWNQGDYTAARTQYQESLAICQELGDRQNSALALNNLGSVASQQGDYVAAHALFEECLTIYQELGDRRGSAHSLINLGNMAKYQGDYVAARAQYEESLAIFRELGNKLGITCTLEALADLACKDRQEGRAARLWGAAIPLRDTLGAPRPPADLAEYEQRSAQARAVLGEAAFAAALAEGRAMTLEQAIKFALTNVK